MSDFQQLLEAERLKRKKYLNRKKPVFQMPDWYFQRLIEGALKRDLFFGVDKEYIQQLFIDQDSKCALSGQTLFFYKKKAYSCDTTASLDRIDNNQPYIPGNVQWIHKDINFMKRSLSQSRFLNLCVKIASHQLESNIRTLCSYVDGEEVEVKKLAATLNIYKAVRKPDIDHDHDYDGFVNNFANYLSSKLKRKDCRVENNNIYFNFKYYYTKWLEDLNHLNHLEIKRNKFLGQLVKQPWFEKPKKNIIRLNKKPTRVVAIIINDKTPKNLIFLYKSWSI